MYSSTVQPLTVVAGYTQELFYFSFDVMFQESISKGIERGISAQKYFFHPFPRKWIVLAKLKRFTEGRSDRYRVTYQEEHHDGHDKQQGCQSSAVFLPKLGDTAAFWRWLVVLELSHHGCRCSSEFCNNEDHVYGDEYEKDSGNKFKGHHHEVRIVFQGDETLFTVNESEWKEIESERNNPGNADQ